MVFEACDTFYTSTFITNFIHSQACWVFQRFNETKFRKRDNIINTADGLRHLLLSDTQLPTRVEAAMAIQCFLSGQEIAEKHCLPHVQSIIKGEFADKYEVEVLICLNHLNLDYMFSFDYIESIDLRTLIYVVIILIVVPLFQLT